MIKSLAALAISALLGASVFALPGVAPQVEAGETMVLAKADRLEVRPVSLDCRQQVWPNFDGACLRRDESGVPVREVRLITALR
jgi:hypothetical protein